MKRQRFLSVRATATLLMLSALLPSPRAWAEDECRISGASQSAIAALCPMKDGFARLKAGGLWGFVDKRGKLAIAPQFHELRDFSEDLAAARLEDLWGFVDKQGRWAIEPRFSDVNSFAHGLAAAEYQGKWGFIDRNGRWTIEPAYHNAGSFNGRSAVVSEGYRRDLLIDMTGRVIKRFDSNVHVYNWPNAFGLYLGQVSFDPLLQHRDGRKLPQPAPGYLEYSEGLLLVSKEIKRGEDTHTLRGAMDVQGNWITPPIFETLRAFHQGLAIAKPDAAHLNAPNGGTQAEPGYGLVDRKGKFKVAPTYRSIYREERGWYRAKRADKGEDILSVTGEVLATFDCEDVQSVSMALSDARNWAVLAGCERTWVLHAGTRAFKSDIAEPKAQATSTHLLLIEGRESGTGEEKAPRFALFNAAGKRVLSNADVDFNSKYDDVVLIVGDATDRLPAGQGLPLALLNRGYKTLQLVTHDYKIVSNSQWEYDIAINEYGYFREESPREGPLPLKTESGWGAVDEQGRWVVLPGYSRLTEFRHGIAFARKDGEPLMLDSGGKEYAFPEDGRAYTRIAPMVVEGVLDDGRSLRFDLRSGRQTILERQDSGSDTFVGGMSAAQKDGKWGLVDAEGRWIFAPTHDRISAVVAGKSKALIGWITSRSIKTDSGTSSLYGWIDATGIERVAPRYDELQFEEAAGVLLVKDSYGQQGALTLDGKVFIEPIYERVSHLGDGWFSVQRKELQGLIDASGEWVVKPGLLYLSDMGHDRSFRKTRYGGETVLYDAQGRMSTRSKPLAITPDDPATWWQDDRETRTVDSKGEAVFYGFDFKERVRIRGSVDEYKRFSEGVIVFTPQGDFRTPRIGLADASGKVLGLYPFDRIDDMQNGFAMVEQSLPAPRKAGKRAAEESQAQVRIGYLDRKGVLVIPPTFENATAFAEERAGVVLKGNIGLIDTKGKLLLHSAWLCGRVPILLDDRKQILWPQEARAVRRCS